MLASGPDRVVCFTCDVEIDREEDLRQFEQILKLFDHYDIKGTFFIIVSARNYPFLEDFNLPLRLERHEIGLHIHWGESCAPNNSRRRGLDSLLTSVLEKEMNQCLQYCRKLNFRPMSFRGGGLCQNTQALRLISRLGFRVDSSVAAKLNQKTAWFQKHLDVPYLSWYFPSKQSYDRPAHFSNEEMGILEIPVTRLIPSLRGWFPYTLEPTTHIFKIIVNEWLLLRSQWEHPLVIVPIFHSWGESLQRLNFERFLTRLRNSIRYLLRKRFVPLKMNEVYDLVA